MSIALEWDWQEWTEADSEALDAAILAERARLNPPKPTPFASNRPPNCLSCGVELVGRRQPRKPGQAAHQGRGRCTSCYETARRKGEFI